MKKEKKEIFSNERRTEDLTGMDVLLRPLARKMLGKKAFVEADVIGAWREIVGEETANFSKPMKIDFRKEERNNGTLWIEAASGAVALELQTKTKILLEKVNTFFGYAAISKIKIIQNPNVYSSLKMNSDIYNLEKKLVTPEEQNYITLLSGEVKTPELSQALEKLGKAVFINNKK